jgi:hypothetical protein
LNVRSPLAQFDIGNVRARNPIFGCHKVALAPVIPDGQNLRFAQAG